MLGAKPQFTLRDLAPVSFIGYSPLIIVANPAFPPRNASDLIEYAKANPSGSTGARLGLGWKQQ